MERILRITLWKGGYILTNDIKSQVIDAVHVLNENKAENIRLYELKEKSLASYIIVATGRVDRHVKSLMDKLTKEFKDQKNPPFKVEADEKNSWIIIDFVDFIVHIFDPEMRNYYQIDEWLDKISLISTENNL